MKNKNQQLYNLKRKSPLIAVLLSLVITGLGHFYLGRWGWGLLFLIGQIMLWTIFLGWLMWIIAPIHAYLCAVEHNKILALEMNITE